MVLSITDSLPEKQYLFDLTIGVVMFTLLVSGPTIRPLMEVSVSTGLARVKISSSGMRCLKSSKNIPISTVNYRQFTTNESTLQYNPGELALSE